MEGRRWEDYRAPSQETGAMENEGPEVDCSKHRSSLPLMFLSSSSSQWSEISLASYKSLKLK